jgi:hypothetical protein
MHRYEWLWFALLLAVYAVPFAVGLASSSWSKAVLLVIASFSGLYLSIWSALGPLFLPLADQLMTRFELSGILIVSFAAGSLQAVMLATLGFGARRLARRLLRRRMRSSSETGNVGHRLSPNAKVLM